MYHVTDRDEGYEHVDDESGSESYPSRTNYGAAWSIGKERPTLIETKSFFGGLIQVPMYGYMSGYTCAQIELMSADVPVVVYKHEKRDKKGNVIKPKPKAVDILRKKLAYEEKMRRGEVKTSLDLSGYTVKK